MEAKEELLSFAATYFFLLRTSCPSVLLKLRAKQINGLNAGHISWPLCWVDFARVRLVGRFHHIPDNLVD